MNLKEYTQKHQVLTDKELALLSQEELEYFNSLSLEKQKKLIESSRKIRKKLKFGISYKTIK